MSKGQAELVAVIAVVALAIVAVYFAFYKPAGVTFEVPEEQKPVKEYVNGLIYDAGVQAIKYLKATGGLAYESNGYPRYNLYPVRYWAEYDVQKALTDSDFEKKIEGLVKQRLKNVLKPSSKIHGKNVTVDLSKLSVKSKILSNRVEIIVDVPVRVEGQKIPGTFDVTIPTKLGTILRFARDFSKEQTNTRFLEYFTIAQIMMSDLPVFGVLSGCGKMKFLTAEEVSNTLTVLVKDLAVNLNPWQKSNLTGKPVYGFEDVNGKTYDLQVDFKLPDGFALRAYTPIMLISTTPIINTPLYVSSYCLGIYTQNYSLEYPMIVRVYDDLMKDWFNFAVRVSVDNMQPAKGIVSKAECNIPVQFTVVDSSGNPVKDAVAVSGECFIGHSDRNGVIKGNASTKNITISKQGYGVYVGSTSDTNGKQIVLPKLVRVSFYIKKHGRGCIEEGVSQLVVINLSMNGQSYFISNTNESFDMEGCIADKGATDACAHSVNESGGVVEENYTICMQARMQCTKEHLKNVVKANISAGSYNIKVQVMGLEQDESKPWINIPFVTEVKRLRIDGDQKIWIKIPDFEEIMAEADKKRSSFEDKIYEDCKRELKCSTQEFFGKGKECRRACKAQAQAEAITEVINWWLEEKSLEVGIC